MSPTTPDRLIEFLQKEMAVPPDAIAVAQRQQARVLGGLPMILWQYGLITLEQLDQVFDWLEAAH
jgi:hypothetical protein